MSDFIVKSGLQIGGGSKLKSGTIAGNATLDLTSGNFFSHTPTADTTFVFNNPPASGKVDGFALKITGVDIGSSYDLANASYDSVSFSVSGQETAVTGVFFKSNGTKMYVIGDSGDDVNEYDLSTAWDISTSTYLQNFSISSQEATPQDLFLKSDGGKMYVVGSTGDAVYEYNLSTAWDISTAAYSQNFSVSAQASVPTGLFFKPDGTKMYVASFSQSIKEYDLSTAWDVSTASFLQSLYVGTVEVQPRAIAFSPDGASMFVVGSASDAVNKYSLSTAWDISSASYLTNFSVAAQSTSPNGLSFKSDGLKMYMASGSSVYQYSTGTIDIATFTYPASVDWPTNGVPPIAPAVGETDVLTFYTGDGGTTYNGFQAGDAMQ